MRRGSRNEKPFIATSWLFHRGSRRFSTNKKYPEECEHSSGFSGISAPRKCFAFTRSRAFVKCPQSRKNSHLHANAPQREAFIATSWLFHRGSRRFPISKKIPGRVRALSGFSGISAPRKCYAFPRSRAFNKCPQRQ